MKKALLASIVWAFAVVVTVSAAHAHEEGLDGKKILLKDNGKKAKINFLAKGSGIEGLTQEQLDSSPGAAILELCGANGQFGVVVLPYDNWKVNKKGLMKYKEKGNTAGIKVITLKPGKTLKIVGKTSVLSMASTLGGVSVRLDLNGEDKMCTYFDATSVKKDDPGKFKAKGGTAPADCADATLKCGSPSGAFLDS